jgi:hypothetical protein
MAVNNRFCNPRKCPAARYVGALSWVCECIGKCGKNKTRMQSKRKKK